MTELSNPTSSESADTPALSMEPADTPAPSMELADTPAPSMELADTPAPSMEPADTPAPSMESEIPHRFRNTAQARAFIKEHELRLFRKPVPDKATVHLLQLPSGMKIVCKDFFDTPNWYRHTVGNFLIAHECGAYRILQGMKGIPILYSRPHPAMMLLEYIEPGDDLWKYKPGELPPEVLKQMQEILEEMHRRGVIHLDIGHDSAGRFGRETNFMWDERNQRLYLIDPAGALYNFPLTAGIRRNLEAHDNLALIKIHNYFFPNLPWTEPEHMSPLYLKIFTKLKKI